jgi:hypothetical protein
MGPSQQFLRHYLPEHHPQRIQSRSPFGTWRRVEKPRDYKTDNVSMQQLCYLTPLQDSNFIPGGFDCMRFTFVYYPTTPRDQWQSFGQLHGWSGGVVPLRLPFIFPLHQGALALGCFITGQSFGCLSFFRFSRGAGKKVFWSGDVGLWWIAPVQLCVSLQKICS